MSTRFDSTFNKPSRLEVSSKHRVLREFRNMLNSIEEIKQEHIRPEGPEIEPPSVLKQHLFKNPNCLTESEKKIPMGYGTAIVGYPDQEELAATLLTESFMKQEPQNYSQQAHLKSTLQSTKRSDNTNYWDAANFSCMNNQLPVYPRVKKGFIDFDLQTRRKDMKRISANENRFLALNPFPKAMSTVKHQRSVSFKKQLNRDYDNKFYNVRMSDSLYKSEDRDMIRPKAKQGVFQFAQSTLGRKGNGLTQKPVREQRMNIGKHSIKIPDASQFPLSFSMPAKTAPPASRRKGSPDQNFPQMFSLEKQLSRVPDDSFNKEQMLMSETLPSYMHHQSTRFGATYAHQRTIRDRNYHQTEFITPKSTLNDKKLFRVNPETQQPIGKPIAQKQKPTFIQLLSKNGYVVEDSGTQPRKRAWHMPRKMNMDDLLDSDSDD